MKKSERIMRRAIKHYGVQSQRMMLIEELGELIQATQGGNRESVIEEMADVTVVLSQVFMIEGLPDGCFAEKSTPADLCAIASLVMIWYGRLARGREYSPACLWMLSGWLQTRAVKMDAVDEVKAVVKQKLLRLESRMVENE